MPIVPTLRVRNMKVSLAFYTNILDFVRVGGDEEPDGGMFSVLSRDGDLLILSAHRGDGVIGQAVLVTIDNADDTFRLYRSRGLKTPGDPAAPTMVHEGPIDQSWGTREFYIDDPDRNTLRFTQG